MKKVGILHLITEQNNRTREKKKIKKIIKFKKRKTIKSNRAKTQNPTADF